LIWRIWKRNPKEPDYAFWAKLDSWPLKDAALLLCGSDPDQFRGTNLRFNSKDVPQELTEAHNRPGTHPRPYLRVANVQRGILDLREIK
jgi:hypothetical protein